MATFELVLKYLRNLTIVLFCAVVSFDITSASNSTMNKSETILHKELFEDYNPNIIPLKDKSHPITVSVDLYLMSIDNIDEKRQTFTVRAFLEIKWRDEFLNWTPEDYNGVTDINVQNEKIWVPDIALESTFDKPTDLGQDGGRAKIDSNGSVIIWPYKVFTISCKIFIHKFPFDEQTCEFDFLSWTNPTTVLRIVNPLQKIDLGYYTESGEWDLLGTSPGFYQTKFGDDRFDHMLLKVSLRRKWLFHALNIMAPVVCISLLNILCFILPAESGERVTLCISVFLTLAVFLTIVTSSMPESSDEVAVFGVYVGLQLLGSALTILMTVLSLYFFHKKSTETIPRPLRLLTKICCLKSDKDSQGSKPGTMLLPGLALANGDLLAKLNPSLPTAVQDVTWEMASVALDRFCFVLGIVWHIALFVSLIIEVNT